MTYVAPAVPGSYPVTVYGSSRNGDCEYDPYGSEATAAITVEVNPA